MEQKDKCITDMDVHINSYQDQFLELRKVISDAEFEQGLAIIRESMIKFTEYLDNVVLKASTDTLRLKTEIQKQEQVRIETEEEIVKQETQNKELKDILRNIKDPRRNVLRKQEYMTCTPDMDVVLSNQIPLKISIQQ
jgi:hypothetical protein